MENAYGTLLVVPLDDLPLADSRRVLIQCTTVDQPYGWRTSESHGLGGTVEDVGGAPWGMERIKASVTLSWPDAPGVTAIACDENGYPTDKPTQTLDQPGGLTLQINPATAYTLVKR